MPNELVQQARVALHQTRAAFHALSQVDLNSGGLEISGGAINLWTQILLYGNRVFTKLEQASKSGSAEGKTWFGCIKQFRKSDPLLRYMQHARNVDEHTLATIVHNDGGSFHVTVPSHLWQPGMPIMTMDPTGGDNHQPAHPEIKIERTGPPRILLQPVTDRGVVYGVPTQHNSGPIQDATPWTLGQMFVSYLTGVVEEAELKI